MAVVRKKQDDKYLKALRELVTTGGGNRQCFDCGQKGPTYVNMTIGSFVCTRCSGVLRGLTPPHRVKSISMATFTQDELDFLKTHGNDACAKTWLGLWDPKRAVHQDHRELMIDKYERKRYYLEPASPLKSLTNAATSLKSSNALSSSTQQSNGNTHSTPLTNGYGSGGGNHKQQHTIDNSFQNIQLTPPTSQRSSSGGAASNGLHKSSSTAISRPQHQQNGFHQQQQDAFMMANNGLSSLNGHNASIGSASTGALSDTSSCASNGFGAEADFVADFGSAHIFDATSASSVGSPAVSSASSVASTNGYAKIQPIKTAQQQFMNGHANAKLQVTGSTNGNTENFADFDHAPIYNAAANYQLFGKVNLRKSTTNTEQQQRRQQQQQEQQKRQQQKLYSATSTDFLANFNDTASNGFNINNNNHNSSNTSYNKSNINTTSSADVFSESTSNFNDPFDDFCAILSSRHSNNHNNNSRSKFATFESDFNTQQIQIQAKPATATAAAQPAAQKFTPLAMAAHATAMAVLGSNCHFNNTNNDNTSTSSSNFTKQRGIPYENVRECGDVSWQDSSLGSPITPISPTNFYNIIWPTGNSSHKDRYAAPDLAINTVLCNNNNINSCHSFDASNNSNNCSNHRSSECSTTDTLHHLTSALGSSADAAATSPSSSSSSSSLSLRLPMPNGISKNSTAPNANNNNYKNKLNSTPAEDRYAALKDLDEQLRESKAVAAAAANMVASGVVDSFGNTNNNNNSGGISSNGVNPFKSQQQLQQPQAAALVNPFQATNGAHNTQNLYGQMTGMPNGMSSSTNGYAPQPAVACQPQHAPTTAAAAAAAAAAAFFNYSNGYNAATSAAGGNAATIFPAVATAGPNGCGFGFGTMQQQIAATGGSMSISSGAFNNPFGATGALNSNNPFL